MEYLLISKKRLEYDKLLGKSYYHLQIEDFIQFFKIDKDIDYALDTIAYFNGSLFIDEIFTQLNFTQFALEENTINKKDFFYAFCSLYTKHDSEAFRLFIQKVFLHFHSTFNTQTNAYIDYQAMSQTLAKSKNIVIKAYLSTQLKVPCPSYPRFAL
ncbi:MAG: hypothetical protein Q9M36_14430 [Sulfurovum sp.]|nr:hypothetical protein [Sulfurovum sp.]